MVYIKNQETGKVHEFNNTYEAKAFCASLGFALSTLYIAKSQGRVSNTGYEFVDSNNTAIPKMAILVSDIHFCYQDNQALSILYQVLGEYGDSIDEYIDMGDGVNNNALSRYSNTEPYKSTLFEEISAYKKHMELVTQLLPSNVKKVVLQDNHFHLRKKLFLADNPAFQGLLPDLSPLFDKEIPHAKMYFPFGQSRFGMIHGVCINDFFTKAQMQRYGRYDVICGHTHTIQTYVSQSGTDYDQPRRSYGIPSMCKRMEYTNGEPTRQVTGFAVLTYDQVTYNYNIETIIIEQGKALFRGKIYVAE